ncbi:MULTISPECIES: hypothetical protein [unclassified Luteimonas]
MRWLRDVEGRAGRVLSSPVLFAACLVAILLPGAGLALWLQPEPHSDWAYYWNAAGSIQEYERGGLGLWLLAIPKLLGLPPVLSALCINLASAALLLWLVRDAALRTGPVLWLACAGYLILISPYLALVQLDVLAATLLAGGLWLACMAPAAWPRPVTLATAVALTAAAVSTKPQYALTLWTMLGLLAVPWLRHRRSHGGAMDSLLWVLVLGSVIGFATDQGLRALGERGESNRTSSAVTLYAGLLASDSGAGCGTWSLAATRAARDDLHKPLRRAVLDRLSARPAAHWVSVLGCKLPHIVLPKAYAIDWLANAPNVRAARAASPQREAIQTRYFRVLRAERVLYAVVTLCILALVARTTIVVALRRSRPAAWLPGVWVVSFWLVHMVFEIQGRYFIGMFLLAPLLCSLALMLSADTPHGAQHPAGR